MTTDQAERLQWLEAELDRVRERANQMEVACVIAYAALSTIADYDAQADETGFWDAGGDGYEAIEAIKRISDIGL